jgi:Mg-chelatase subunit ChlD
MNRHATALLVTIITAFSIHIGVSSIYEQSARTEALAAAALNAAALSNMASIRAAQSSVPSNEEEATPPDHQTKDLFSSKTYTTRADKNSRPKLDLAFCIDTTGSMQGEIDMVKTKVKSMVAKLSSGQPKPIVRVGLVAYRDEGDEYVTKVFPFSGDIDKVVKDIADLNADGGGDTPEAVDKGLHSALNDLQWDDDKSTAKLLFLIGDAPPHDHVHDFDWKNEARKAGARGIRINTIGCDGLELDGGVPVFKQIASMTNGKFQTIAYHQEVVNASGRSETLITSGGVTYTVKPDAKGDWKAGSEALVASGNAAPSLQGATNGTIGPQRSDNNLDQMMLQGAQEVVQSK